MELTERQNEYLFYMRKFFIENDQLPTGKALAVGMGVTLNAAHEMLDRLADSGAIQKNACNKWMFSRD